MAMNSGMNGDRTAAAGRPTGAPAACAVRAVGAVPDIDADLDAGTHDHEAVAAVFRALAEPARLRIVHALTSGEQRVRDLVGTLELAQSTVSAHVAVLREAGLVTSRAAGRSTYYALATAALPALVERAEDLLHEGLSAVVHDHPGAS